MSTRAIDGRDQSMDEERCNQNHCQQAATTEQQNKASQHDDQNERRKLKGEYIDHDPQPRPKDRRFVDEEEIAAKSQT